MYFIELLKRNKTENSILVKGWALGDAGEQATPSLSTDVGSPKLTLKLSDRPDVARLYQTQKGVQAGFLFKAILPPQAKTLTINFGESAQRLVLDLTQKVCHPQEVDSAKNVAKRWAHTLKPYVSSSGLRLLYRKLLKQASIADPAYARWIEENEPEYTEEDLQSRLDALEHKPLISLVVPVYKMELKWFEKMVQSVQNQTYPNWQLCLADDNSGQEDLQAYMRALEKEDSRINVVFRPKNGHISEASNSALLLAKGEYTGLLDDDDALAPNALLEVAEYLNENPECDMVYSDEDKIDVQDVRSEPHFKSDYAPDTLLSVNYICHFTVIRTDLIRKTGGFRTEYNGAQDHDLFLRIAEQTDRIGHIPKILYHWRMLQSSTAAAGANKNYAAQAGVKAVKTAIARRGYTGTVKPGKLAGNYLIEYDVADPSAMVSIIIPTKDNPQDIRTCVSSIMNKTVYERFEILIVDNGSVKKETHKAFKELTQRWPDKVRVERIDIPFNYSRLNDMAVEKAKGNYLLFLNDDTEVLTTGWLKKMLGYAQLPWVGAVGARLYYDDTTIQHAGVVMGIGGIAAHIHSHLPKSSPGYMGRVWRATDYVCVTAACLLVSREKFEQVGGFDQTIVVAFNDVDLCCKLYDKGWYAVYLPDVELFHYESKSRGYEDTIEKKLRFAKEIAKIQRKWRKYIENDPMYSPNLTRVRQDFSLRF